jgi:hypothetical protein
VGGEKRGHVAERDPGVAGSRVLGAYIAKIHVDGCVDVFEVQPWLMRVFSLLSTANAEAVGPSAPSAESVTCVRLSPEGDDRIAAVLVVLVAHMCTAQNLRRATAHMTWHARHPRRSSASLTITPSASHLFCIEASPGPPPPQAFGGSFRCLTSVLSAISVWLEMRLFAVPGKLYPGGHGRAPSLVTVRHRSRGRSAAEGGEGVVEGCGWSRAAVMTTIYPQRNPSTCRLFASRVRTGRRVALRHYRSYHHLEPRVVIELRYPAHVKNRKCRLTVR